MAVEASQRAAEASATALATAAAKDSVFEVKVAFRNEIENMRQQGAAMAKQLNEMREVVQGVVRT